MAHSFQVQSENSLTTFVYTFVCASVYVFVFMCVYVCYFLNVLEAVFMFMSFRVFYRVNLTGLSMTFESSLLVEMSWAIKFVYAEKKHSLTRMNMHTCTKLTLKTYLQT